MRAGLATERFNLVELKKTKNKYGKFDQTITSIANGLGGDIRVLSSIDRINEGTKVTTEVITIRTYFNPLFSEKKKVQWQDNTFDILSVEPGRKRREVVITAERKL